MGFHAPELQLAAWRGEVDRCRQLLDGGEGPGAPDPADATPLMAAAGAGHLEVVSLLLERGAEVNAAAFDGATALHVAVCAGQGGVARRLLQAGADPERVMGPPPRFSHGVQHYWQPMDLAASNGDDAMMQLLSDGGAHVRDHAVALYLHRCYERMGRPPSLHDRGSTDHELLGDGVHLHPTEWTVGEPFELPPLPACLDGGYRVLEDGIVVFAQGDEDTSGALACFWGSRPGPARPTALGPEHMHLHDWRTFAYTPALLRVLLGGEDTALSALLWLAARGGRKELVEVLLQRGAVPGEGPIDPVAAASYYKHGDIVLLLSGGPRLSQALCNAAYNLDDDTVMRLLERGADPTAVHDGDDALGHCLRSGGKGAIVRALLAAGASPHGSSWGVPLLYRAAERGEADVVEALLGAGADPNRVYGKEERTPLHACAAGGRLANARRLLAAGADPMARARGRRTPLHVAAESYPPVRSDIVTVLLLAGAQVDARDGQGRTPLHTVVATGMNTPLFKALLAAGANPLATDRKGLDAVMLAARSRGNAGEVVPELLARGVPVDARGPGGETALMMAARHGSDMALATLLEAGADVSLRNDTGQTALEIGREHRLGQYWLRQLGGD